MSALVAPGVSLSTVLGLAVMDMVDAGQHVTLYVHGMSDDDREALLDKLVEFGLVRDDNPLNGGNRGVVTPDSLTRLSVQTWGSRP